jgi:hypothetical protein
MGGALDIICSGDHVIEELNNTFGYPQSDKYKHAQSHNTFGGVSKTDKDNYEQLIGAYEKAGVKVSSGWRRYLKLLGSVRVPDPSQGPLNIWTIADFRNQGLLNSDAMITDVHTPEHGGHVHTQPGLEPGQAKSVSSPCPLPEAN